MTKKLVKINTPKINLKSNKNLIITLTLVIILITIFAPKLLDLTGRAWSSTGGPAQRTRYVDIGGVTEDHKTYTLDIPTYGTIQEIYDYDPILFYDTHLYALTDEKTVELLFMDTTPTILNVRSSLEILNKFTIDESTGTIWGTKAGDGYNIYKIDTSTPTIVSETFLVGSRYRSEETCGNDRNYEDPLEEYLLIIPVEPLIAKGKIFMPIREYYINERCDWDILGGYAAVTETHYTHIFITAFNPDGTKEKDILLFDFDGNVNVDPIAMTLLEDGDTLAVFADKKISLIDISSAHSTSWDVISTSTPLDCTLNTELIQKDNNYLYFICGSDLYKFDLIHNDQHKVDIGTKKIYAKNAFAILDDKLYYGNEDGNLIVFDILTTPPTGINVNPINILDDSTNFISTIATVNDIIYIGSTKGKIFAIDPSKLNNAWVVGNHEWLANAGTAPIYSIIIPYDDVPSMLAFGKGNNLYLFDEPLEALKCTGDFDCLGTTPICDTITGDCEACSSNTECATKDSDKPTCKLATGECVQCTPPPTAHGCIAGETCYGNVCVLGCFADHDCTNPAKPIDPNKSACDLTHNICVECNIATVTSDCATGEVCYGNTCVECTTNVHCTAIDPDTGCDTNTNTCLATCSSPADCSYGETCYTNLCMLGCNVPADCSDPTPACHPTHDICVQCTADTDCTVYPIKTKCTNNICVEPLATCSPIKQKIDANTYCDASGNPQPVKQLNEQCTENYQCPGNTCYAITGTIKKCQNYNTVNSIVCGMSSTGLTGSLSALYTALCGST